MSTRRIRSALPRSSPSAGTLTSFEKLSRFAKVRTSQWRRSGSRQRRLRSEEMTYADKFSRLATRLKDGEWRRLQGILLLTGKALGLALLFALIVAGTALIHLVSGTPVFAQQAADPYKTAIAGDLINPDQHGLGAAWRVSRVRYAGRIHDARGRLLPES